MHILVMPGTSSRASFGDLSSQTAERKAEITELMREGGIDLQALKEDQGMSDVDDFDFICQIAYG